MTDAIKTALDAADAAVDSERPHQQAISQLAAALPAAREELERLTTKRPHNVNPATDRCVMCGMNQFNRDKHPSCAKKPSPPAEQPAPTLHYDDGGGEPHCGGLGLTTVLDEDVTCPACKAKLSSAEQPAPTTDAIACDYWTLKEWKRNLSSLRAEVARLTQQCGDADLLLGDGWQDVIDIARGQAGVETALRSQLAKLAGDVAELRAEVATLKRGNLESVRADIAKCFEHDTALFAVQSDEQIIDHLRSMQVGIPTTYHALIHSAIARLSEVATLRAFCERVVRNRECNCGRQKNYPCLTCAARAALEKP